MGRGRERDEQKEIALERIRILFRQAQELAPTDGRAACERVKMARDISLRCNARIPRELKLRFCRKCLAYFTADQVQCRLNSREHRMELKCRGCGHTAYVPYVREKMRGK